MDPIPVEFAVERTTVNTIRFQEAVEDGVVPLMGTVYLQKSVIQKFLDKPTEAKRLKLQIIEVT